MIKNKIGDYKRNLEIGKNVLTMFLDFEEQKEILALNNHQYHIELYGGYEIAERKRVLIKNEDDFVTEEFKIAIIQSKYNQRFAKINHRHVLGTIMSLGIERNTFGDIIVDDELITIFVTIEIKDYLIKNLTSILNYGVKFTEVSSINLKSEEEVLKTINVASMRLDAVISKAINCSRSEAVSLIEKGLVLVNHQECLSITHQLKADDLLSIRKFGRIRICCIKGYSKKERIILQISVKH